MKLTIENLGRIRAAELELKPLTVFIGENNTNKTWTAHALFGLLEGLRAEGMHLQPSRAVPGWSASEGITKILDEKVEEWMQLIDGVSPDASISLDIQRDALVSRLSPSDALVHLEKPAWFSLLGSEPPGDARASLRLEDEDLKPGLFSKLSLVYDKQRGGRARNFNFSPVEDSERSRMGILSSLISSDSQVAEEIRNAMRYLMLAAQFDVRALPAERKLLSYVSQQFDDLSKIASSMPKPLVDFIGLMRVPYRQPGKLQWAGSDLSPELMGQLKRLVGGELSQPDKDGPIFFRPENTRIETLELQSAASLVKSLTGLDVFLRGARKGDVLIIDEPEMNAHPAAQMGIVELFAMMANQGIRVVLATHSPYILDHLTNLVEASTLPAPKRAEIATSLALKSEAAFLDPDKLAVQWFKTKKDAVEVEVREAFDRRERDIDWSTFSDRTDRISALYSRILDAADERDA